MRHVRLLCLSAHSHKTNPAVPYQVIASSHLGNLLTSRSGVESLFTSCEICGRQSGNVSDTVLGRTGDFNPLGGQFDD